MEEDVPELIDTLKVDEENPRIPVTLITGFLGAGKSTLLQRILTEKHGYRIAVIVNEFADTADIEARAISVAEGTENASETTMSTDLLELPNGCLCCTIKDTGVAAIENLMKKKGAFDYILLETTGLADPGPIVSIFWRNEEFPSSLGKDLYLDGVLCVVDALNGPKQLHEDHNTSGIGESLRQIAGADVILLNKCDLNESDALSELESNIRSVNPTAPIYRTIRGEIDVGKIIGLDVFRSRSATITPLQQEDRHDHDHGTEGHLMAISSLQIPVPILSPSQFDQVDEWTRSLLWEKKVPKGRGGHVEAGEDAVSVEVLRAKGLFAVRGASGDLEEYLLQGVQEVYDITRISSLQGRDDLEEHKQGKIVLIGKGLSDVVATRFQHTIASQEE